MCFIHTVIFKSLLGPGPRLLFEQIKQRQETTSLAIWADERFTRQRYCQKYFLSTPVLLFLNSCYPGSLAHLRGLCFSQEENWAPYSRPGLNIHCDPALPP